MIPVIFGSDAKTYTTNGLGRLTDCVSCLITEERNGIYELELTYPITGVHYDKLVEGNIIVTTHDEQKDKQPFVIYRITRPISGIVTVNAHHVSYALSNVIISPFTASSVTDAFNYFSSNAVTDNPFTFWTDKTSSGTMTNKVPTQAKALLGGQKGSVLDSFGGGEYEFDGYTVKLYADRGSDNGVTIRYGKNLTDLKAERDVLGLYNAVIPYWSDSDTTVVYGGVVIGNSGIRNTAYWTDENNVPITDENGNIMEFSYYVRQVTTMDLSAEFDEQPTVAELEARALAILNNNQPWIPKDSIKVDFVALWQTEEYASVAPLERVRLCDTVSVYYPELGVDAKSKVVKVVWDALLDRYDSIELGVAKSSFAEVITADTIEQTMEENKSMMDTAIQHATDLITGGLGGHVVFVQDANGHPTELLVMDTDDVATAVHVLRINVNGIGFSSTGVSGTYSSAWTLDGSFVADFITAGHLSANRIQGGTLTLGGNNNGNGVLSVKNASGTEIGRWDRTGITVSEGSITGGTIRGATITLGGSNNGNGELYVRDSNDNFIVTLDNTGVNASAGSFRGSITNTGQQTSIEISNGKITARNNTSNQAVISMSPAGGVYFCGSSSYVFSKNVNAPSTGPTTKDVAIDIGNDGAQITAHYFAGDSLGVDGAYVGTEAVVHGDVYVDGAKSRSVKTGSYGARLLYCYETPTPFFGDIGDGVIAEDGLCYVMVDAIFAETVSLNNYQVFLQAYGEGECYVEERKNGYFVVRGNPGLKFGWEIKSKQVDFDQYRLERNSEKIDMRNRIDYAADLALHMAEIKQEREVS